ncbi:unnamed protein product [Arabis nemorensis]|uniref:26S proteasome non-ATPase regulatory subunit 1/RPN2 N-terminal domain-containing protein n=1 Tax=Arabis nemorensis TaxID=586526 RepID=A0A565AMZ6_9BRAS|nr:unnamed protein product [Arabis nemorensis]
MTVADGWDRKGEVLGYESLSLESFCSELESLYEEDESFDQHLRRLAALLVSKVQFNFHVSGGRTKAIDEYAILRSKAAESTEVVDIDRRLEAIVERMLDKCISDGMYQQAMGIAIEYRRLDK